MAIEDIEDAIYAALTGDVAFSAFVNKLSTGRLPKETPYPYVEMTAPMDTRTGRTSDSLYYWKQVQFKTYAQDRETAGNAGDLICEVLNDDVDLNQYVPGINVIDVQRGNCFYLEEEDAVWCYTLLFNVKYTDPRKRLPIS